MSIGVWFPFDRLNPERFSPSYDGNSVTNADRVVKIQYGDGYAQYIRDGENWQRQNFSYTWKNVAFEDFATLKPFTIPQTGDCTDLKDIPDGNILYQFLETVRTLEPFNFTLPRLNKTIQVRCSEYELKINSFHLCDITAKFETDYSLN